MLEDDVFAMAVLGLACLVATVIAFRLSSWSRRGDTVPVEPDADVEHREV